MATVRVSSPCTAGCDSGGMPPPPAAVQADAAATQTMAIGARTARCISLSMQMPCGLRGPFTESAFLPPRDARELSPYFACAARPDRGRLDGERTAVDACRYRPDRQHHPETDGRQAHHRRVRR